MVRSISLFVATLSLSLAQLSAETLTPIGFRDLGGGDIELVTTPSSTLVVTIEVERESTVVGLYARYAQKFLGVRAPLVAKQIYSITGATISKAPEGYYLASEGSASTSLEQLISSEANTLPIDSTSASLASLEESAESAAESIFEIRQLRRDILTGELGEGFYGGGLVAALERLQLEEEQYMALFFGHTERSRSSHTRYLPISGATNRYIISRFNPESGLVDSGDLTAEPLILQLTTIEEEKITAPTPVSVAKSRVVTFRVPSMVKSELYYGTDLLAMQFMPLIEFGYNVDYYIPTK